MKVLYIFLFIGSFYFINAQIEMEEGEDQYLNEIYFDISQMPVNPIINCISFPQPKFGCEGPMVNRQVHNLPFIGVSGINIHMVSPLINYSRFRGNDHHSPSYYEISYPPVSIDGEIPYSNENRFHFYFNRLTDNTIHHARNNTFQGREYFMGEPEVPDDIDAYYLIMEGYGINNEGLYFLTTISDVLNGPTNLSNTFQITLFTDEDQRRIEQISDELKRNYVVQFCEREVYVPMCRSRQPKVEEFYVLGYGIDGNDDSFLAHEFNYNLKLKVYLIFLLEGGPSHLKLPVWDAKDGFFPDFAVDNDQDGDENDLRKLLELNFSYNIIRSINSGEEYGHIPNEKFFSSDDVYYAEIDQEEKSLKIKSSLDHSLVNTLNFGTLPNDQFYSLKINNNTLDVVSKSSGNQVVKSFNNCISPNSTSNNSFTIENGVFLYKEGNNVIWRKSKEDQNIQCSFPAIVKDKLAVGEKLIMFNQISNKGTDEYKYLLNTDGNNVLILDQGTLKLINKIDFNGDFLNTPTINEFPLGN